MSARAFALFYPSLPVARPAPLLGRMLARLAVLRQRRALADLPDHLLADIGISRRAAETEAQRPLWDVPPHWQR